MMGKKVSKIHLRFGSEYAIDCVAEDIKIKTHREITIPVLCMR